MAEVPSFVGTDFDIFARKPRQLAVEKTPETIYKPIASIDQADIEFLITGDSETYIDLDLKLFIKGKLMKGNGTNLTDTDYTARITNLLNSLFSQCSISLNGTKITQATELYNYRAYLETLLTYGTDAADSHLKILSGTWTQVTWKMAIVRNVQKQRRIFSKWNRMKKARLHKCTGAFIKISATFHFISQMASRYRSN